KTMERVAGTSRRARDRADRRRCGIVRGREGERAGRAEGRLQVVACERIVQIVEALDLTRTGSEGDRGGDAIARRGNVQRLAGKRRSGAAGRLVNTGAEAERGKRTGVGAGDGQGAVGGAGMQAERAGGNRRAGATAQTIDLAEQRGDGVTDVDLVRAVGARSLEGQQ